MVRLVLINILMAVILSEAACALFLYISYGQFYRYKGGALELNINTDLNLQELQGKDRPSALDGVNLHPFFGYTYATSPSRPDEKCKVETCSNAINNYGFESVFDYPVMLPGDNYYVVMIGGSMAGELYEKMSELIRRQVKGVVRKNVVLINLTMVAYKQPQPLFALIYLLFIGQKIDIVINVDGYNDVFGSWYNYKGGIAPTMPARGYVGEIKKLTEARFSGQLWLEELGKIAILKDEVSNEARRYINSSFALEAAFHLARGSWSVKKYRYSVQHLQASAIYSDGESVINYELAPRSIGEGDAIHLGTNFWRKSSEAISALSVLYSFRYVHVLHPNQSAGNHKFSAMEMSKAFSANTNDYVRVTRIGYADMVSQIEQMKSHGVPVFNATSIFDDVHEEVYRDVCCHLTDEGLLLLARFVADRARDAIR